MIEHLSKSRLERLSVRALPPSELTLSTQHLAICQFCRRHYQGIREMQRGGSIVRITLAPELWLRHEHLEYEQLVALADQTMAAEDLELANLHIKICATCREDMRSFLDFRKQIAPELSLSYGPAIEIKQLKGSWFGWWRGLSWQLRYAAVIVLAAVTVASLALWKQRANTLEARRNKPPITEPKNQLSAPASPITNETATTTPPVPGNENAEPRAIRPNGNREAVPTNAPIRHRLRDNDGVVAISETGAITGLDHVPASTRRDVALVLISQSLPKSEVLSQLADRDSSLRGRGDGESFALISPARTVIVENRPLFRWEGFPRAENYRLYVTDSAGEVVAKSDWLEPAVLQWSVSLPLKRGEIYSWAVVALVDGKEIVSPNASASEIRFQILSSADLDQLSILRKSGSHLALGVFCAKVGLLAEARRELLQLVRLNPRARTVQKLLRSL